MLSEMMENESNDFTSAEAVLLASGTYESDAETVLAGYKTYQKRYVVKQLAVKLVLVIIAAYSSVVMYLSDKSSPLPILLLLVCVCVGWYFISEPLGNKKKLSQSLEILQGTEYKAEIYTDRVIISTVSIPEEIIVKKEDGETETDDEADDGPPATVIHLDSPITDFIDRESMFIICVKRSYVFIIPKSAFTEEETAAVREKLAAILGYRYKLL